MKRSIVKLFILVPVILLLILLLNLTVGTNYIQDFDCKSSIFPDSEYARYCLPSKNFGFHVWTVFYSIPLLTFLSGLFYRNLKIFLFVDFIWIFLTEFLVRAFHMPTIYNSLEHPSLQYSIFAVQVPLIIYSEEVIVSGQMKVLAILVVLSLGSGYLGSLLKTIPTKLLK